jgi:hypothetical protein
MVIYSGSERIVSDVPAEQAGSARRP